jgi:hypothetical protein
LPSEVHGPDALEIDGNANNGHRRERLITGIAHLGDLVVAPGEPAVSETDIESFLDGQAA